MYKEDPCRIKSALIDVQPSSIEAVESQSLVKASTVDAFQSKGRRS